jgi:hypothetical protein
VIKYQKWCACIWQAGKLPWICEENKDRDCGDWFSCKGDHWRDIEELTDIAIEDKIPKEEISALYHLTEVRGNNDELALRQLYHNSLVYDITGKSSISKRFAERVIQRNHELEQRLLGRYDIYSIKLIIQCILLLYDDRIADLDHEARRNFFRKNRTVSKTDEATNKKS